jgi:hypothetical protein
MATSNPFLDSYPESLYEEPLLPAHPSNPNPPQYRRSTKPANPLKPGLSYSLSILQPSATSTTVGTYPDDYLGEKKKKKSKTAILRIIAKTVVHPRKTRRMKKAQKAAEKAADEAERTRNIEEFLASGRRGPWDG